MIQKTVSSLVLMILLLPTAKTLPSELIEQKSWLNTLKTFADSHDYSEDYNCINYSKEAIQVLQGLNISAIYLVGRKTENGSLIRHAFIGVLIEPQTGNPISVGEYKLEDGQN